MGGGGGPTVQTAPPSEQEICQKSQLGAASYSAEMQWCRADENYRAQHAGGYRLEGGKMFPIRDEAFMLVSDLDDTMFGDDEASLDFKDFWERDARLRGSCLVPPSSESGRCSDVL